MALPPHPALVAWLRRRLAEPLPGLAAQLQLSPPTRGNPADLVERARGCRQAAVLVLLYPLKDTTGVVLTLRQQALKSHSGQISFPGGSLDPGETAEQAARREAWEEVGVPPEVPDVLGHLSELYIPPSNFCVEPVVAALDERPPFEIHTGEVARLIEVPLPVLLDPANRKQATWTLRGQPVEVPYFAVGSFEVWGATAMMLSELLTILRELDGA